MFTPYAVATLRQARNLLAVKQVDRVSPELRRDLYEKGWIEYYVGRYSRLTPAGRVALGMREILGPDRELTKSQAGYLTTFGLTPSMHRKLVALGLIENTPERQLTEDGQKIKALLAKNGVRFT